MVDFKKFGDGDSRAPWSEIERARAFLARAEAAFRARAEDPEALEREVITWEARGRAEFGPALGMTTFLRLIPDLDHLQHHAAAQRLEIVQRTHDLGEPEHVLVIRPLVDLAGLRGERSGKAQGEGERDGLRGQEAERR